MPENKKFNPDLRDLLTNEEGSNISRYSLVTATAKLAREIAEEDAKNEERSLEKPVTAALEKLLDGEYKINEPEEIKDL